MDPLGIDHVQQLILATKPEDRHKALGIVRSRVTTIFASEPFPDAFRMLLQEECHIEQEYVKVTTASFRRAGMMLVRAILNSMPGDVVEYPSDVLDAYSRVVLKSIVDADPQVRIAAAEACHELVRKFGVQLLQHHFLNLFFALASAIGDRDYRVATMAQELSATVRELISAHSYDYTVDLPTFVSFLCATLDPLRLSGVTDQKPVALWTLEWAQSMFDVPSVQLGEHITSFLRTVLELPEGCADDAKYRLLRTCQLETRRAISTNSQGTDVDKRLRILVDVIETTEVLRLKKFCIQWMGELLQVCQLHLGTQPLYGDMVLTVLQHAGSWDEELRSHALAANASLARAAASGTLSRETYDAMLSSALTCAKRRLSQDTREKALQWIVLLFGANCSVVSSRFNDVFESTLRLLKDPSQTVLESTLDTLCLITDEGSLDLLVSSILELTRCDAAVLLPRLPTIVKQLQLHYQGEGGEQCEKLLEALAKAVPSICDTRFICKVVITVSTMLLTSAEFARTRELLKRGLHDERAAALFATLAPSWRYNGAAFVALALLCRFYALSFGLLQAICEAEVSPETLLQFDRLAQLLESPVFSFVRIAMLEPSRHLPLVKTLFALLALLPQTSPQYTMLCGRLKLVPGLSHLETLSAAAGSEGAAEERQQAPLLQQFAAAQQDIFDYQRCNAADPE